MRVCGLLVFAVFVLGLGRETEVFASPAPAADPCSNYFNVRPRNLIAATEPPKTEEEKIADKRKEMIEVYRKVFQPWFLEEPTTPKEPEQPTPKTADLTSFLNAYVDLIYKFINMFQ